MKKKLKASGSGWELYFSKQLLKLLGYNPTKTKLLITSKANCLYLTPIENDLLYLNKMVKAFHKSGGSYGIYFPLTLISVLDINPETDYLELEINVDKLIIKGK